jgi:hypothetical protein
VVAGGALGPLLSCLVALVVVHQLLGLRLGHERRAREVEAVGREGRSVGRQGGV